MAMCPTHGGRGVGKAQGSAFPVNPLEILMYGRTENHFPSQQVAFRLLWRFLPFPLPHLCSLPSLSFQCLPHLVGPNSHFKPGSNVHTPLQSPLLVEAHLPTVPERMNPSLFSTPVTFCSEYVHVSYHTSLWFR